MSSRAFYSIIGYGVIGSAVHRLFKSAGFPDPVIYDPMKGYFDKTAFSADIIFVCVPTPSARAFVSLTNGKPLSMTYVESVICDIACGSAERNFDSGNSVVVICSTLQPGTADRLAEKHKVRIVVQPEYYGESVAHPMTDLSKQPFLILGGEKEDVDKVIRLYQRVYNANIRIRRVSRLEAEVIKVSENRAIAWKVAQCQELFDACEAAGLDYEVVRQAVYGDDPRFNLWFTFVYPDDRGFHSKCIPKDVYAWEAWARGLGVNTGMTRAILATNEGWINGNPKRVETVQDSRDAGESDSEA